MAITVVPSVVTGQAYSAANFNTHIRDNINGIWVLTTAGDMLYATGASAAARLALVPGGVMYGGASAPAWLTPPGVPSILKKLADTDPPEWLPITQIPGRLIAIGSDVTDSVNETTSTSYVSTGLTFNLSLAHKCTVIVIATGTVNKNSGSSDGFFKAKVNGTLDPNETLSIRNTAPSSLALMSIFSSIPAGTREVDLQFRTANAGDALYLSRGILYAMAFIEE